MAEPGQTGTFTVEATAPDTRARAGTLVTEHGDIPTPIFMPVGTRGAVRTQTLAQINELAPPIVLANTYHLMVRPGRELFERVGGLHAWIKWSGAVLTDSGGFQIFSLAGREMTEEGARFRDRASPAAFLLTPESSIGMQRAIGSDIMMVLDQCIDSTSSIDHARAAMELTHRWAKRSLDAHRSLPPGPTKHQLLFAIVQGACYPELRRESARALTDIGGFDGYAIGGLAVGESKAQREDTTELATELLPRDRPRYLMGVGTPIDLLEAVHRGVDMFDCILPTAWAQHGKAFTSHGRLDMRRGVHKSSDAPLDTQCTCVACTTYERSFLHHLVKAQEPLGWQLLANHNLKFYLSLMKEIRGHIVDGTFASYYADKRVRLAIDDEDNPPGPKPKSKPVKPSTRGAFSVATHTDGFASIRHIASGETMHSVNRPDDEAERVYIQQSALIAENARGSRPLVVWDVGLGAAHNAMALIRALEANPRHAPVELVSFENDTDAFQLALAHQKEFAHLRHPAAHVLAKFGSFTRGPLMWRLVTGDFSRTFLAEKTPDVIFYDPFSAKVDAPLWTLAAFRTLRAKLDRPAELFTYTASTAIRSALLGAGFWVARGVPSGPKEETTIALVPSDPLFKRHALLDAAWLARRARSTAKLPSDVPTELAAELENAIATHAQFASDLAIASEVLDGRACVS
ncbi:MAG TPA: tRNA guanosine(34) transglycosylase Tgt [Kofleriaceae bacterium]